MSRKYCSVCGDPHDNRGDGLCDIHLAEEEQNQNEAAGVEADMLCNFLDRSEPNRWEIVFDFMRSKGWEL